MDQGVLQAFVLRLSALNTAYAETQTTNTDGGIENAGEAERSETSHGGDSAHRSSQSGGREEAGDRSRVSEELGENSEGHGEVVSRINDSDDASWLTDKNLTNEEELWKKEIHPRC